MKKIKLTTYEKNIEKDLLKGVYVPVSPAEFREMSEALARRKKDTVLNIRVNSQDLTNIKHKARKLGLRYQTFLSEIIHRVAV
jgi:predicted DNA binding CopG/RHH family protein